MTIETIMVIGAGQMGRGIVQVAADAGFTVLWNDVSSEFVQQGMASIAVRLARNVNKGDLSLEQTEAVFAVFEGVAEPEAVDQVMKLGMNHPMGPLELADFIGLDTCLSIMEVLYDGYKDPKYRPCPLLRKYVKAGRLGRKSGQGFYRYR